MKSMEDDEGVSLFESEINVSCSQLSIRLIHGTIDDDHDQMLPKFFG